MGDLLPELFGPEPAAAEFFKQHGHGESGTGEHLVIVAEQDEAVAFSLDQYPFVFRISVGCFDPERDGFTGFAHQDAGTFHRGGIADDGETGPAHLFQDGTEIVGRGLGLFGRLFREDDDRAGDAVFDQNQIRIHRGAVAYHGCSSYLYI